MLSSNPRTILLKICKTLMTKKAKYTWNTEFIKLIHEKVCPYCNESLIHKGILNTCKCGFYILGACETLAYERISQDAPILYGNEQVTTICPECSELSSNFIYDDIRAETVCTCGLVIDGPPAYSSYRKISYDNWKGVKE